MGVVTYGQRIIELHREARQTLTGRRSPLKGDLLLGASSIPGEHLLPGALSIFRRQFPDIRVRVAELGSTAVLDLVERGKVHLGLVGLKTDNSHLEFRAFATDELWRGTARTRLESTQTDLVRAVPNAAAGDP